MKKNEKSGLGPSEAVTSASFHRTTKIGKELCDRRRRLIGLQQFPSSASTARDHCYSILDIVVLKFSWFLVWHLDLDDGGVLRPKLCFGIIRRRHSQRKNIPVNQLMKNSWHDSRINVILKCQFTAENDRRKLLRSTRFFPFKLKRCDELDKRVKASAELIFIAETFFPSSSLTTLKMHEAGEERKQHKMYFKTTEQERSFESEIEKQFECLMRQSSAWIFMILPRSECEMFSDVSLFSSPRFVNKATRLRTTETLESEPGQIAMSRLTNSPTRLCL